MPKCLLFSRAAVNADNYHSAWFEEWSLFEEPEENQHRSRWRIVSRRFTLMSCVSRTHAERSAAPDARSGGLRDPAAGQLPRVLHSGHALPDGRDSGRERLLRAGRHELVRSGVRRRRGEVSKQLGRRFSVVEEIITLSVSAGIWRSGSRTDTPAWASGRWTSSASGLCRAAVRSCDTAWWRSCVSICDCFPSERVWRDVYWLVCCVCGPAALLYELKVPRWDFQTGRQMRTSPLYDRLDMQGARWMEKHGFERAKYFVPAGKGEKPVTCTWWLLQ